MIPWSFDEAREPRASANSAEVRATRKPLFCNELSTPTDSHAGARSSHPERFAQGGENSSRQQALSIEASRDLHRSRVD